MVMSRSDGCEAWYWRYLTKEFPFMAESGLQRSSKPDELSGGGNMGFDHGQPMRSRWSDRGCRRRWQSDVTASYDRGTD
jgi:hypothetical protein